MRRALLPLLLLACAPAPPSSWTIEWNGLAKLDAAAAIAVAQDLAPCRAGADYLSGGTIIFYDGAVQDCGGAIPLSGCWDWDFTYRITWRSDIASTALLDELGHAIWMACHGEIGENGNHDYDADFAAWVGAARAELQRRVP